MPLRQHGSGGSCELRPSKRQDLDAPTQVHVLCSSPLQYTYPCNSPTGVENSAADSLSRNNFPTFLPAVPEAADLPTPIPTALVDMVVREQPDWSSPHWAQLFSAF